MGASASRTGPLVEDRPAAVPGRRLVGGGLAARPQAVVEVVLAHAGPPRGERAGVHGTRADLALLRSRPQLAAGVDVAGEPLVVAQHAVDAQDMGDEVV